MRLSGIFLPAGVAVSALPSPQSDFTPRSPTTPVNALTLIQPVNTTSSLTDDFPILCYYDSGSYAVDRQSCSPLIDYLVNTGDFHLPKLWVPGPDEPEWKLRGCKLRLVSGKWESTFSMQDVVVEMERVLAACQPPMYLGIGGSAPVDGKAGFLYAAFHAEVTGVEW